MSDQNKIADPVEYVSKSTDIVMCDGGSGDLGHPAVYFKFGKKNISFSPCFFRGISSFRGNLN